MEQNFYRCEICGNIITHLEDSGIRVICCGQEMTKLTAGAVDASVEKHVPVITQDGSKVVVSVGSVAHPMTPEHYIQWICLVKNEGTEIKYLTPTSEPRAEFAIGSSDSIIEAYEYCSLHGLWKA